jgi:ATP/maltotriose-dependent transcriptional regulator MalT
MGRARPTHVADPTALGKKIRQLREERGLSLRQIAFPGCSASYLSRVEAGDRVPSMAILARLAAELGTTVESLLGRRFDGRIAKEELAHMEVAARLEGEAAQDDIRRLLATSREIGDRAAEGRLLELLGMLALDRRDDDEAVQLLELAQTTGTPHPRLRPQLYRELGRAYAMTGDYGRSIAILTEAFEAAEEDPLDPSLVAQFGTFLANAYTDQGSFQQAEATLARVLRHEELFSQSSLMGLEWSMARTYGEQGRSALAEAYTRKALNRLEQAEERRTLGNALMLLAGSLINQGRYAEASADLDRAEDMLRGEPGPDVAWLSLERARLAIAEDRIDDAESAARRALTQIGATEPTHAAAAYLVLGDVALARDNTEEARQLAREAVAGFDDAMPLQRSRAFDLLSRAEERAGNLEAALAAARTSSELLPR